MTQLTNPRFDDDRGSRGSSGSSGLSFREWGAEVLRAESDAILSVLRRLDSSFDAAVDRLVASARDRRQVLVTGMGKAGHVGVKVSATLASTGTPAHFLHPAEAVHGDLGRVSAGDVVLAFSNSGETEEVVRLLPSFRDLGADVIAITRSSQSTLGRNSALVIALGEIAEACSLGLAPSATTAAMIAVGDALALTASRASGFEADDFARYHPGGSLGRHLACVEDVMRPLNQCRVAQDSATLREVLACGAGQVRRTGATLLLDDGKMLSGIFTDSDLVRRIASGEPLPLDEPVRDFMTPGPKTILAGSKMKLAVDLLSSFKISELPVIDGAGRPVGLIDVTDVVELMPAGRSESVGGATGATVVGPRIFREPQAD